MVRNVLLALTALLFAGCGSTPPPPGALIGTNMPPPDSDRVMSVVTQDYVIGPMDVLDVTVFQVPEMTRAAQVDASGEIMMPLIGSVPVSGKTARAVQEDLTTRLREKYFQNPEVTVIVKEFASQRITVEGAVSAPGVYALTGRTTLLQTLATAKGVSRDADLSKVVVFRTVNTQRMAAVFDLKAIRSGRMADPELYGNDVVVVDYSGIKSVLRNIGGAVPAVGLFRPFL